MVRFGDQRSVFLVLKILTIITSDSLTVFGVIFDIFPYKFGLTFSMFVSVITTFNLLENQMLKLNWICFILSTIAWIIHADDQATVTIQNGAIVGGQIFEQNVKLYQFLGIPYAQPPIGELRYQRPRPFQQKFDQQPFQATEWPNSCSQVISHMNKEAKYKKKNFVEDCLYLNIWSPQIYVEDENHLRPVIVYIHGGGLLFGSSTERLHDGRTLSALADAVVVTINYRLSTFGLLYADQVDGVKGNMAFWDQAMALEWVQENIRYFGGQPKMVTIMGESAGSWSVSAHVLSPVSRNLFQNAYMMSGSVHNQVTTEEQFKQIWLQRIRKVGCASESDHSINKQMLDCLDKLDAQQLSALPFLASPLYGTAVIDGEFFPEHPEKMLANGNHKKNFNLMVSTMEDEFSGLLPMIGMAVPEFQSPKFAHTNPEYIEFDEAKDFMKKFAKFFWSKAPTESSTKIYFNGINSNFDDQDLFRRTVGIAIGDMWLACPTVEFGKKIFRGDIGQTNVYQLYNTYKLGMIKDYCTEWAGACHADDLYPLFGVSLRDRSKHLQREREISMELISIVKSFIRTGHPNQTEQPEWQSFFMYSDGQLIAPYYHMSNHYRTYQSYGIDLKQAECRIWNKYNV